MELKTMNKDANVSKVYEWIITIFNSATDGTVLRKFTGTTDEVMKCLMYLIEEDKVADPEGFMSATSIDGIVKDGKSLLAWTTHEDYGVDYTAIPLHAIPEVGQ